MAACTDTLKQVLTCGSSIGFGLFPLTAAIIYDRGSECWDRGSLPGERGPGAIETSVTVDPGSTTNIYS